jgi:hypothetical protein
MVVLFRRPADNWAMPLYRSRSIALLLLFSVFAFAKAKEFVMPKAYPAKTYPAHDEHTNEKLAVAADPYDEADKAAIFTIKYAEQGYLPVFMVFTNDGDTAISLNDMRVELITHSREKIQAATEDDLYRRFTRIRRNDSGRRVPLPLPLPGSGSSGGVKRNQRDELGTALFAAKAVAPHESESGFVFFDVSDVSHPLAGARIVVTGVSNGSGQELMYFEIPMENYLGYTPPGSTTSQR